jgi:hypothetical protein
MHRLEAGVGGRDAQQDRVGAVGDRRDQDSVAGFADGSAAVSIRPACAAPVCPTVTANESANFDGSIFSARAISSAARDWARRGLSSQIARRDFRLFEHVLDDLPSSGECAWVKVKRSSHEWAKRSPGARQVSRNSRVSEALASISAITLSLPSTNAAAPSPLDCSALPSGAASRQSPIATSALLGAATDRIGALQHRRDAGAHRAGQSDARISAGSIVAAPITAALSFSA